MCKEFIECKQASNGPNSETPERMSGRVPKSPVRFQDIAVLSMEDPVTHREAMGGLEKEKRSEALDSNWNISTRTAHRSNLSCPRVGKQSHAI